MHIFTHTYLHNGVVDDEVGPAVLRDKLVVHERQHVTERVEDLEVVQREWRVRRVQYFIHHVIVKLGERRFQL